MRCSDDSPATRGRLPMTCPAPTDVGLGTVGADGGEAPSSSDVLTSPVVLIEDEDSSGSDDLMENRKQSQLGP